MVFFVIHGSFLSATFLVGLVLDLFLQVFRGVF